MISLFFNNGTLLYSSLLPECASVSTSRVLDIVGEQVRASQSFVDLQVDAEDENGVLVYVPTVRIERN